MFTSRDHILDHLSPRFHGSHGSRVEFRRIGAFETPVAIHPPIIIDEHRRVESQHAIVFVRVVLAPVAHLERSVGTVALRHQSVAPSSLVVGIEVIGLFAIGSGHQRHVGSEEHIGGTRRVEGFALGVSVHLEDLAVVAPLAHVFDRSRPHHEFASAVVGDAAVVRPIDIDPLFARLVGIFKHVRFAVGNMFPERQIGIAHGGQPVGLFRRLGTRHGNQGTARESHGLE